MRLRKVCAPTDLAGGPFALVIGGSTRTTACGAEAADALVILANTPIEVGERLTAAQFATIEPVSIICRLGAFDTGTIVGQGTGVQTITFTPTTGQNIFCTVMNRLRDRQVPVTLRKVCEPADVGGAFTLVIGGQTGGSTVAAASVR